jgi:GNAT superfamily N-acetyltransferase
MAVRAKPAGRRLERQKGLLVRQEERRNGWQRPAGASILLAMSQPMAMRVRLATEQDIPRLRGLIAASVRALQAEDYSPAQIAHALETVFGVDSQLIADRTYFIVEAETAEHGERQIAGCGGWSRRKKLYGGDAWTAERFALLDPAVDAAKIRAFFIAPEFARRGVGTRILQACEEAAFAEGFRRLEMGATLTGVKLFAARGYVAVERIALDVGGGESIEVVRMEKCVAA